MKKLLLPSILTTLLLLSLQFLVTSNSGQLTVGQVPPFATVIFSRSWISLSGKTMYRFDTGKADQEAEIFTFFPSLRANLVPHEPAANRSEEQSAWFAFTVYSYANDSFFLVTDGLNHRILELISVSSDGKRTSLAGQELRRAGTGNLVPRLQAVKVEIQNGSPLTIYLRMKSGKGSGFNIGLIENSVLAGVQLGYIILLTTLIGSLVLMVLILVYIKKKQPATSESCIIPFLGNLGAFCLLSLPVQLGSGKLDNLWVFLMPALSLMLASTQFVTTGKYFNAAETPKVRQPRWFGYIAAALAVGSLASAIQLSGSQQLAEVLVLVWLSGNSLWSLVRLCRLNKQASGCYFFGMLPVLVILTSLLRVILGYPLFDLFDTFKFSALLFLHNSLVFSATLRRTNLAFQKASHNAAMLGRHLENQKTNSREQNSKMANTMINSLHGIMELLEDSSAAKPDDFRDTAAIIRRELGIMKRFFTNIQGFNNQQATNEIQITQQNLGSIIKTAINLSRYLAANRNISYFVSGINTNISSDGNILHKLLAGLIFRENIISSISRIDIYTTLINATIQISISNDGDPELDSAATETAAAIWDPDLLNTARMLGATLAWKRDDNRNHYVLGLPLVLTTQDAAGGSGPSAESQDEESSDRFHHYLQGDSSSAPSDPTKGKRALIVMDEPVSLFANKRRLERAQWGVHSFLSPRQALAALSLIPDPDALLIEASMQDMTGYELCAQLRQVYPDKKWPIILVIANNTAEQIKKVFDSGANDYLIRPFSESDLIARISTHTELAASLKRELKQKAHIAEVEKIKTLSWLTAGLAHEINTPNNAILRNVPVLKEIWTEISGAMKTLYQTEGNYSIRGFNFEELQSELPAMLNDVYVSAQHIRKIVQELKEYSGGGTETSFDYIDLNQAISYAVRLVRHAINGCGARFTLEQAAEPLPVYGDKLKLAQVVVNILENSIQSLERSGAAISVRSRLEQDTEAAGSARVIMEISDEGCGMSEESLKSAFDPFYTTKRNSGGTGLGLAVVSGIIREHNGSIEIQSARGQGTSIRISLPARPAGESQFIRKI